MSIRTVKVTFVAPGKEPMVYEVKSNNIPCAVQKAYADLMRDLNPGTTSAEIGDYEMQSAVFVPEAARTISDIHRDFCRGKRIRPGEMSRLAGRGLI